MSSLEFGTEHPVALITGSAAPRVGRAIARKLASEGFSLAIHGNQSVDLGNELVQSFRDDGVVAEFFKANLEIPSECETLVEQVINRFQRLDVLVNSAAIWYPTPLESVTQEELEKYMQINSLATFSIARLAGLQMVKQEKGGVIINLGDWAPLRPYADYSAYFLSKGNLPTLTSMLAVELAQRNPAIRVNAVLPGPVMIPKDMSSNLREQIINATLLKKEGRPENVAAACFALIENDFITGACLPVDGGRSIYSPYNPV